jgi:hypothetical protein
LGESLESRIESIDLLQQILQKMPHLLQNFSAIGRRSDTFLYIFEIITPAMPEIWVTLVNLCILFHPLLRLPRKLKEWFLLFTDVSKRAIRNRSQPKMRLKRACPRLSVSSISCWVAL